MLSISPDIKLTRAEVWDYLPPTLSESRQNLGIGPPVSHGHAMDLVANWLEAHGHTIEREGFYGTNSGREMYGFFDLKLQPEIGYVVYERLDSLEEVDIRARPSMMVVHGSYEKWGFKAVSGLRMGISDTNPLGFGFGNCHVVMENFRTSYEKIGGQIDNSMPYLIGGIADGPAAICRLRLYPLTEDQIARVFSEVIHKEVLKPYWQAKAYRQFLANRSLELKFNETLWGVHRAYAQVLSRQEVKQTHGVVRTLVSPASIQYYYLKKIRNFLPDLPGSLGWEPLP